MNISFQGRRQDMDTVIQSQFGLNWMDKEEILSEADYYKYFTESGKKFTLK